MNDSNKKKLIYSRKVEIEQVRQCTYNVTLKSVRATTVAVE